MSKAQRVTAQAKHLRISPRKIRLVVDQVRGLSVTEAEHILQHMNKKGAEMVLKVVRSAAANAVHNNKLDRATLRVAEAFANEGFVIKRYRARAFGRASAIRKKTSDVTVIVEGAAAPKKAAKKETPAKAEKKPAAKKATDAKKEKPASK